MQFHSLKKWRKKESSISAISETVMRKQNTGREKEEYTELFFTRYKMSP